jgi:hypothetical protein
MATTINPTTLTYSVTEQITLNGIVFDTNTENTVTGIGNYVNNIFNVDTGSQGIIVFSRTGVAPRDTEYDIDNVKYIRISNADDTNNITVTLDWQTSSNGSIVVAPGGSFILTEFINAGAADTLASIIITATANADVPYVIGLTS